MHSKFYIYKNIKKNFCLNNFNFNIEDQNKKIKRNIRKN